MAIILWASAVAAEGSDCVGCHEERDAALVADWQASGHGGLAAGCAACHGEDHEAALERSRRDSACIDCHGGGRAPVVHSYTSSKHGVIMRLEAGGMDWNRPLKDANYRVPGCAYCHMHAGRHGAPVASQGAEAEDGQARTRYPVVCQECHAPRYVTRLFDNGRRMLAVGRMKLREAEALVASVARMLGEEALAPARERLVKMRHHLHNVRLGIGHQSPDYQWWHGQPALDGDLLRIKGLIGRLQRQSSIDNTERPEDE
ncbi:multiheme c-type cytochrome [Thiohalobacter sp. IOR34]|uniref:multiheme c-type cytochrome n=1 Tax=Thiohalobacter sp. IOR34 TaxID=3057176 RepID=UPI0025AEDB7D|nr:multiheme c-type cytochrome [Thiohalobacter sp. IOR34]WJW76505.1 multiheme c-type cytochrome [Thiohalobacter sp. IOR34]